MHSRTVFQGFLSIPFALVVCGLGTVGCGATVVNGTDTDASVVTTDAGTVNDTPPPRGDRPSVAVDVPPPGTDVPTPELDASLPTSCGPQNDGRVCADVGLGCGTTSGGGECATSVSCTCEPNHRWHCVSSTVPFPCDAGVPERDVSTPIDRVTPPDDVPPPVCSLVGRYAAMVEGQTLWFEFTSGGVWRAAPSESSLPTAAIIQGTYTFMANTLTLTGERRGMGGGDSDCRTEDIGRYLTVFARDCSSVQLAVISDDCAQRGEALGRFRLERR